MDRQEFRKKWGNYWYYYKYHTYAGIVILIMLVIIIFAWPRTVEDAKATIVDGTGLLLRSSSEDMLDNFAEEMEWEGGTVVFKNFTEFVNPTAATLTQTNDLQGSISHGYIEGVFVTNGSEYQEECVGNIKNVLSGDLINKLGDGVMAHYLAENDSGEVQETDKISGIIVNDAKMFRETYGEFDEIIVLQIPENCKNQYNAEAFVRYLFGL